jgi:hypothetical protein
VLKVESTPPSSTAALTAGVFGGLFISWLGLADFALSRMEALGGLRCCAPSGATLPPADRVTVPTSTKEGSVHAVVVTVTISDHEVAESHLREQVVPGVRQAQGS